MLANYFKVAFGVFLRRKFFTFVSLFGIAVTLVVLTVAVSFFDHMFGPHAPESRADRTLSIYMVTASGPKMNGYTSAGYGFHDRYVRDLPGAERVSVHSWFVPAITYMNGTEINFYIKNVDSDFWNVFDFTFLEGGPLTQDDEDGGKLVAVINETTRGKIFGKDPAVGKMISLDHRDFRVVGVVNDVPMLRFTTFADVWIPITSMSSEAYKKEFHSGMFFSTILARRPEDLGLIRDEFASMLTRIDYPDSRQINKIEGEPQTVFEALSYWVFGGYLLPTLLVLMLLFMLLPTINLVNVNVSRIRERASEIGVRKAFGATGFTLVGQFVVENVLLTLVGGVIGFFVSFVVLRWISATGLIPYAQFEMNYRIFFLGFSIAVFFGILSGVYPAWKMSRLHPVEAISGRAK